MLNFRITKRICKDGENYKLMYEAIGDELLIDAMLERLIEILPRKKRNRFNTDTVKAFKRK